MRVHEPQPHFLRRLEKACTGKLCVAPGRVSVPIPEQVVDERKGRRSRRFAERRKAGVGVQWGHVLARALPQRRGRASAVPVDDSLARPVAELPPMMSTARRGKRRCPLRRPAP